MGTNVDFHNVSKVKINRINKYKAGFGGDHWYTIQIMLEDTKKDFHQLTIYTESGDVIEQLNTANLVIDEVA